MKEKARDNACIPLLGDVHPNSDETTFDAAQEYNRQAAKLAKEDAASRSLEIAARKAWVRTPAAVHDFACAAAQPAATAELRKNPMYIM